MSVPVITTEEVVKRLRFALSDRLLIAQAQDWVHERLKLPDCLTGDPKKNHRPPNIARVAGYFCPAATIVPDEMRESVVNRFPCALHLDLLIGDRKIWLEPFSDRPIVWMLEAVHTRWNDRSADRLNAAEIEVGKCLTTPELQDVMRGLHRTKATERHFRRALDTVDEFLFHRHLGNTEAA